MTDCRLDHHQVRDLPSHTSLFYLMNSITLLKPESTHADTLEAFADPMLLSYYLYYHHLVSG